MAEGVEESGLKTFKFKFDGPWEDILVYGYGL